MAAFIFRCCCPCCVCGVPVIEVAVDTVPPPPDDCNTPFFEKEYVEREDEEGKDGWGVLAYVVDRGSMT